MTQIITSLQSWKRILIACPSCKTSYDVLMAAGSIGEQGGVGGGGFVDIQGERV